MFSSKASFRGGTHITAQKKLTSGLPIIEMEAPPYIYLPLSMHIGAPGKADFPPQATREARPIGRKSSVL
jgi:Na+-translocating ferredoxin:NAD+ oxidoreductase RnfC subunit